MSFTVRLLETLFRHKLLVLFPIFVLPMLVTPGAVLNTPVYYETWTNLWVQRPTYLQTGDNNFSYTTPAQQESARIQELLKTRTFLASVASRTVLAPLAGTPAGEERIQGYMSRNLSFFTSGSSLLSIRMRAETPQMAYQLATAVVDAYRERVIASRLDETGVAVSFYEQRANEAQQQLDTASEALRRYITANPRLGLRSTDPSETSQNAAIANAIAGARGLATLDPELGRLQSDVDNAQKNATAARDSLEKAKLQTSAALQGADIGLQVVDPARMPTRPFREVKKRGMTAAAASVMGGFGLSALILCFLMFGDRTVRSEGDLAKASSTTVLGVMPKMHIRRAPGGRAASADLTRRAIGFVAGTALPAPLAGGSR